MHPLPDTYLLIPQTIDWFWFALQLLVAGVVYRVEGTDRLHLAYSKFRKENQDGTVRGGIPTRAAMLIIYGLPLLTAVAGYNAMQRPDSVYHIVLFIAIVFHFAKRCLEVLFVHRYSKPTGLGTALLIGGLYSYIALSAHYNQNAAVSRLEGDSLPVLPLIVGGLIFLAAQGANFYHHLILRNLRRAGDTTYVVPKGGLFELVGAPHYLFEILAWIGYAIMARHLGIWGIVFIISGYLAGRAVQTREWYLKNVPGYPENRRALLPGVL
jgi:very-long-chain enoyl-CoA reductase